MAAFALSLLITPLFAAPGDLIFNCHLQSGFGGIQDCGRWKAPQDSDITTFAVKVLTTSPDTNVKVVSRIGYGNGIYAEGNYSILLPFIQGGDTFTDTFHTDLVQKGAWFAVGVLTNKHLAVPLDLIITVHTIAARTKK